MKRIFYLTLLIFLLTSCNSTINIMLSQNNIFITKKTSYSKSALDLINDFNKLLDENIEIDEFYENVFDIDELLPILNKDDFNSLISIDEDEEYKHFSININKDNYMNLANIFEILKNENIEIYTAKYNTDETEESFLDIIDFVFGKDIKDDFEKSVVNIIINDSSGKIEDKVIRAIDFALLHKPIVINFSIKKI